MFSLDVYLFTNNTMCMQLKRATNKRSPHLELVVVISIIGIVDGTAHRKFHHVQNLWISLDVLRT